MLLDNREALKLLRDNQWAQSRCAFKPTSNFVGCNSPFIVSKIFRSLSSRKIGADGLCARTGLTREGVWRVVIGVRSRDDARKAAALKDAMLRFREKLIQNLGIGWRQMWSAAVPPAEPHADRCSRKQTLVGETMFLLKFWTSSFSIRWSSRRLSTKHQPAIPPYVSIQVSRVIRSAYFTKSLFENRVLFCEIMLG
ncbi:hypothetical protein KC324_g74 [Hortaea werneckii]|nr:hypothetical protein KC324_g74 [Hortaea werneckii]